MHPFRNISWLIPAVLVSAACSGGGKKFDKPMVLGGKEVSAATLEHGREAYIHNCRACHGDNGDGGGPAAYTFRPPPRDFTATRFKIKFGAVESGKLPTDEDFKHILRYGLHGTAMLPWDVEENELDAIIQYIKTFSPRWQKDKPGETLKVDEDPWKGKEAEAVVEGKRLYHTEALCATCHASYATQKDMWEMTKGEKLEVRPNSYWAADPKDSDYRVILTRLEDIQLAQKEKNPALMETKDQQTGKVKYELKTKIAPPDFLFHRLRAIHDDPKDPRHALNDTFRTISLGIPGTAMPAFRKGAFNQPASNAREIWAMAHYVESLRRMRGTADAIAFRTKLITETFTAPPAPAPEGQPPGTAPAPGAPAEGAPPATGAAPGATGAAPAPAAAAPAADAPKAPPAPKRAAPAKGGGATAPDDMSNPCGN